jgi:hypothetical protein
MLASQRMRNAAAGNRFPRARLRTGRDGRAMLVTLVQSVVRSDDENFSPLDKTSRKEAGDHADEYFLDERIVHVDLVYSMGNALRATTRSPIARCA